MKRQLSMLTAALLAVCFLAITLAEAQPAGAQTVAAPPMSDCTQRTDLPKAISTCLGLVMAAGKDAGKLAAAYSNLGNAQRLQGDLKASLTNLGWALVYDRKNPRHWLDRATTRAALGQNLRGAADATLALRYDPKLAEAFVLRSDLHRKLGALDRAVSDATEALKIDPKSSAAYANRAYARLRLTRVDQARTDAEDALKIDPNSVRALLTRGLLNEKTDKTKARDDILRALKMDPKEPVALDAIKRFGA